MRRETTETVEGNKSTRPGPIGATDRRGLSETPVERAGATPWQFDTRIAKPKASVISVPSPSLDDVARSYLGLRRDQGEIDRESIDRWKESIPPETGAAGMLRDLHLIDPSEASRLAKGLTSMPRPGDLFLGFRLIDEIGRGAFGRVYLAQQGDLADRCVALKVSAELKGESQTLAQLQHTNIVPIFSVHQADPFQAVCMPYFGATTLKDVCDDLAQSVEAPASGRSLLKNLSTRRSHSRMLPSKVLEDKAADLPRTVVPGVSDSVQPVPPQPEASDKLPHFNTLRMIGDLPFDEAVLWIGSRLADGLAHAHERGILHRDLKPANILLTDDGQPMLLDFNLSEQVRGNGGASAASVGGTLPYMAPEHLAAFQGQDHVVDERSDLYALGIILYELLARRHPFPVHEDSSRETLTRMIAERQGPPPRIRTWDDRVSPAAESIVRHCLEADPARRYQSVRDLHEDLERHLADLPLKHAPEPSIRERTRKLIRRNPRLGTWIGATIALLAVIATSTILASRGRRLAQLEAVMALETFRDEIGAARSILSLKPEDRTERDRGYRMARNALGRYRVLEDRGWFHARIVNDLPPEDRQELREEVGEALLILAETDARDASDQARPTDPPRRALNGLALSGLAMTCFDADKTPRSLFDQRVVLMNLIGRQGDAKVVQAQAQQVPMRTARDFEIAATDHLIRGDVDKALKLAEESTRLDPRGFWAWFTQGACHDRRERPARALACFQTCVALKPEDAHSWFNRGLCYLRDGKAESARADFDRAIEIKPEWSEAYLNRALARRDLGDFGGAAQDLTRALNQGATDTRIYFLRATARARLGDAEGARKDREAGLTKLPSDTQSWIARAYERMTANPDGALADFEKANELDPTSLQALHMRAHVLAVSMNKLEDAAVILDRAIQLYPEYVPARCFRGVIRAIQGRRDEAIKDAREALWRDSSPATHYQLAGLYATTSRLNPEDRSEAYRLLHSALRQGYGFDLIAGDHELDPIRDQPEFRRLVDSVQAAKVEKPADPIRP